MNGEGEKETGGGGADGQVLPDMRGKVAARKSKPRGAAPDRGEPDDMSDPTGGGLGPECPATILGVNGDEFYFLDSLFQLRVTTDKFDKGKLYSIFTSAWVIQ